MPQDPEAKQSVLGGMLLSSDAISDVLEIVQRRDFCWSAHQVISERSVIRAVGVSR